MAQIGKACYRVTTSRTMTDEIFIGVLSEPSHKLECALHKLFNATVPEGQEENFEGWWCINIQPLACPMCEELMCYVEPRGFHLIVVWEDEDDGYMRRLAWDIEK